MARICSGSFVFHGASVFVPYLPQHLTILFLIFPHDSPFHLQPPLRSVIVPNTIMGFLARWNVRHFLCFIHFTDIVSCHMYVLSIQFYAFVSHYFLCSLLSIFRMCTVIALHRILILLCHIYVTLYALRTPYRTQSLLFFTTSEP